MWEEHKKQLEQQLWNIADTLRGKMSADEFRNYILGFIFYKYLSEKLLLIANKLLVEWGYDITYDKIDENSKEGSEILIAIKEDTISDLWYFLKPSELFSEITKRWNSTLENNSWKLKDKNWEEHESNFILEDLMHILHNIENSTTGTKSEDDFIWLFEDLDLTHPKLWKSEEQKNELISKVLSHLDKIDFKLEDTKIDVIWDAYEYLIGQFASWAWKKAWEFYTPQEVSQILSKIVVWKKAQIKSVYDPTCGSWSLLLRVAKEVKNKRELVFYWQELNRSTYNLARMNMILHGVHFSNFNIRQEDTLEYPQHRDKKFEAIVANPPFSAKWSANPQHMTDDRFSQYWVLAPSSKADFAFVQHMIHHLDDNWTMAVVLPHWALFRWGVELHIRKYLIENRNYLDAVIWLPANIFYWTTIPTCILVFKKCREHPNNILFIDASGSENFEKSKNQNKLRVQDIKKIVDTYNNRIEEDKYSYLASLHHIAKEDYNLNISRYVDTSKEEDEIDLLKVSQEIKQLDLQSKEFDIEIKNYCKELWIDSPF